MSGFHSWIAVQPPGQETGRAGAGPEPSTSAAASAAVAVRMTCPFADGNEAAGARPAASGEGARRVEQAVCRPFPRANGDRTRRGRPDGDPLGNDGRRHQRSGEQAAPETAVGAARRGVRLRSGVMACVAVDMDRHGWSDRLGQRHGWRVRARRRKAEEDEEREPRTPHGGTLHPPAPVLQMLPDWRVAGGTATAAP